jgi:DNA-3-methyladenine glycosylase I
LTPTLRCGWAGDDPLMQAYHDHEWGVPQHDDRVLFEFLILEGAQAGLSWSTILNKRENYRRAFDRFDPQKVVRYTPAKVNQLLKDEGIVRNRLKIESAITNAYAFMKVQKEFGSFDRYLWSFVKHKPVVTPRRSLKNFPARTPLSDKVSEDLQNRGFKFVGSTIVYAYLQAVGVVNDHMASCFKRASLAS